MVAAAAKQLQAKLKKASPTLSTEKALILIEVICYIAFINRHYSNPPTETSLLDCIAAKRLLPCSLCPARTKRTTIFPSPPSAALLPALTVPKAAATSKVPVPRKLKVKRKEREIATTALVEFRNNVRALEQLGGKFR
ncbi:hypothetical protein B0H14DRAFT_2560352 [Mycena olivaceomarginata]|nr:hypothetical protein B0H14DRAFT_2560352 [Mycena olivaceomarginata]